MQNEEIVLVVMDRGDQVNAPHSRMTRLAFLTRLDPELNAIYTAAETSVDIKIFIDKVKSSEYINPADDKIINGMNALVTFGLITRDRAEVVMKTPITDKEALGV